MLYQPINEELQRKQMSRTGLKLALLSTASGVIMAMAFFSLLFIGGIFKYV